MLSVLRGEREGEAYRRRTGGCEYVNTERVFDYWAVDCERAGKRCIDAGIVCYLLTQVWYDRSR